MTNELKHPLYKDAIEDYYRARPERLQGLLESGFEEYVKDSCTSAFLRQLTMVAKIKGISDTDLEIIHDTLIAMGYEIKIKKIEKTP